MAAWTAALTAVAAGGCLAVYEARTSSLQAHYLSRYAADLSWQAGEGVSDAIRFPQQGPFNERLGYTQLPRMLSQLESKEFVIDRQARFSPALLAYTERGLFPPYREKVRAGLIVNDCRAEPLYQFVYPQSGYGQFEDIPSIVVDGLLFIENRGLLDAERPYLNPAVDWVRFAKAGYTEIARSAGMDHPNMGGSTLATQIEKYRHSAEGLTADTGEKLRQMLSASIRAYRGGQETLAARRELILSYLNTVPLSAAPGQGEVHGLGEGLRVWFGADFATDTERLRAPVGEGDELAAQGLALRRVIALMIAQRRPSYYLVQEQGRADLASLSGSYLRLMARDGQIDPRLSAAAQAQSLAFRNFDAAPALVQLPLNKGATMARSRLTGLLDVSAYQLDRMDLVASATLNADLQAEVSAYLARLREPTFATQMGLIGERLLSASQPESVRYSFTLFERTAQGNRVRVQTDNTDQPFDINEGSKLELGSTAKLRVLVTYLEVIAELHQRFQGLSPEELEQIPVQPQDTLTRWVLNHLHSGEQCLEETLAAALERRYSANPQESFFTGGGVHTFSNFRREENSMRPTVREAIRESINLPFVRMLEELVNHFVADRLPNRNTLLLDDSDPRRQEYLARFADREGLVFLQRFWRKYQDKTEAERLDVFIGGLRQSPERLAAVHRYLFPETSQDAFASFLRGRLPAETITDKRIEALYRQYGPGQFNLPDQAYVARVHPLEMWLLGYLSKHPEAPFAELSAASTEQRQQVYAWLLRTRAKNARDSRIRTMLEVEAFLDIHQRWKRVGYPFDHLVPSLATALGSSGDRPAALAELMGIIVNDGIRQAPLRIDDLQFGVGTPYETRLHRQSPAGEQVMLPEVAAALRDVLTEVVENGTGRRLRGSFGALAVGGKTGTGDNRIFTVSNGGQRSNGRALNRTATFVFYIGPNHFGTLTAFVPGQAAANFKFTSVLPVQVLKGMAPILEPYLDANAEGACRD
ncbi:penicillin-binding protein [Proteobacteria bacterium 005FR1]|nr:penicillin-binding protein [Proteobacteria bacterium 005FR1]